MLGSFEVLRNGEPVDPAKFGSRKARTLLRWLADSRNAVVPEDVLLEALWPGSAADDVLRSFRVRVSELRKAIASLAGQDEASTLLERTDNGYRLHTRSGLLETDVDVFTTLASAALQTPSHRDTLTLLKRAIELYRGDYLSDDPYTEQWRGARQRYHNTFVTVTGRLAHMYERNGRYEEGIHLLQRLLAEPHRDEDLYRKLIRLQYLHGDQAGALRTFEECRDYLQNEFDANPMPQTMRLFKQVLRQESLEEDEPFDSSPATRPLAHKPRGRVKWPFLGRTDERTLLKQKLDDLAEGQGGIVWLHGPSGIGKSRLFQEAINSARADGNHNLRHLSIFGSKLNAEIPFAAVLDGLQAGLEPDLTSVQRTELTAPPSAQIQRLLGWTSVQSSKTENDDANPPDPARNVVLRQEFLTLFERLAQQMPLICHLENVQYLDSTSRALFVALAKRVTRWPLLIVVCSRRAPDATDIGMELFTASPSPTLISVEPLSPADLRPLVAHGVPTTATERWLKQLYGAAGGEPAMLVETLDALKSQSLIDLRDGHIVFPSGLLKLMTDGAPIPIPAEPLLPSREDEFQRAWRDELDEGERSLLQKAAILGDALTLERLEQLSTEPIQEFQRKLERMLRKGYFTMKSASGSDGPTVAFADQRTRRRIQRTVSESEQVWYHGRAFNLLQKEAERFDEPSLYRRAKLFAAVANHALLAEKWEEGALWSLRAADAAQRITPGLEVVALARRAYDAARRIIHNPTLFALARRKFAEALYEVGSYEEALPLYEEMARHEVDDDGLNPQLVRMYLHFHRMEEALGLVEQMLHRSRSDATARGQALLLLADVYYRQGKLSDAIARGERALAHFTRPGQHIHRLLAHRRMGLFFWDIGEYGHAIKHSKVVVDAPQRATIPDVINSLNQLGELYQDIFCTALAHRTHREALILAQNNGRIALGVEIWRNIGLNFVHEGQMDKGIKILERSWQQAVDLNLEPYRREIHLRALLEAHTLAHRPEVVRDLLQRYQREVGPRETPFVAIFTFALAFLEGRLDEGEALLDQAKAFWNATGRRARAAHVLLFAGQELVLHGRPDRAEKHLREALAEMERICEQVSHDIADQVRSSRQYRAAQSLLETVGGQAG